MIRMTTFRHLLYMLRCWTLLLHLRLLCHLYSRMLVMHRFWRLWLFYRGHERYAADGFFYAVDIVINAAGGSLYKHLCGVEPVRHSRVPQAPSSIQQ
jgi:hypothetical protein